MFWCLAATVTAAEPNLQITLERNPDRFVVAGFPLAERERLAQTKLSEIARRFTVFVRSDGNTAPSPLFGEHRLASGHLVFEPRYPLQPGLAYRASLEDADRKLTLITREFELPAIKLPPPAIVASVFPSRAVLPENQLKFYFHFSAPMSRGEAYRCVHLYKASGERVERPFLELDEELWDASGTRFTLFFDPGRIKRGLKPREEMGPALEEGAEYRLVIEQEWHDATGQQLARPFVKRFRVEAPDYGQPDPARWQLLAPAAGTREPLRVTFDEPLDHAMLMRVIQIAGPNSDFVPVLKVVDKQETRLSLLPQQPWQAGEHTLVTRSHLEDLAGNSIERPFEVDIFKKVERQIAKRFHRIKFNVE